MTKEERRAIQGFMINALNAIFPNHNEYPFAELRDIEENEGDESDKFDQYGENVLRAYWMKRHIETISGGNVRF